MRKYQCIYRDGRAARARGGRGPECATCLKNLGEAHSAWAESSDAAAHLAHAEAALRRALDLLPSDSDALFSLRVVLSKRGDDAEQALVQARERVLARERVRARARARVGSGLRA